jgi:hypothetical protein
VWINRYSKYWQQQFDTLAAALEEIDQCRLHKRRRAGRRKTETRGAGASPRA